MPRRDHVAVIGPFRPLKGGIAGHTTVLADALETSGAVVDRFSWVSQYPRMLYRRDERDPAAPSTPGVRWWLRWWNPASWARVAWVVRRHDVVVLPWVSPAHGPLQLLVLLAARRARRVVHVHNVLPHEPMPLSRLLARLVLGRADLLVCHASALADELAQLGVRTPVVVTPMLPIVARDRSDPPPWPPIRLLFAGAIRRYKGLDIALDALALLDDDRPPLALTIAGEIWDDNERPSAERLAALDVEVHTEFRYVSDDELATMMAEHHLVLAPYRSATQSGMVSVALAAGRPVVVTPVGGLPESVEDGVTGVVAGTADAEGFAAAIQRALASIGTLLATAGSGLDAVDRYVDVLGADLSPGDRRARPHRPG
ncbi:MAG: glycosyltransferase [Acidimicrobiales bacterium]|nr:glycosyltransferase [Acidimicrobiales bacterium]